MNKEVGNTDRIVIVEVLEMDGIVMVTDKNVVRGLVKDYLSVLNIICDVLIVWDFDNPISNYKILVSLDAYLIDYTIDNRKVVEGLVFFLDYVVRDDIDIGDFLISNNKDYDND